MGINVSNGLFLCNCIITTLIALYKTPDLPNSWDKTYFIVLVLCIKFKAALKISIPWSKKSIRCAIFFFLRRTKICHFLHHKSLADLQLCLYSNYNIPFSGVKLCQKFKYAKHKHFEKKLYTSIYKTFTYKWLKMPVSLQWQIKRYIALQIIYKIGYSICSWSILYSITTTTILRQKLNSRNLQICQHY